MSSFSSSHSLVDAHLHCVDFSQHHPSREVFAAAIKLMPVQKAVIMGLPVIKKWSAAEHVEPLRAQDDNGSCYYYSYTDQIVADLYSSLPADDQQRVAPLICGFNPTDKRAINHIAALRERDGFWAGVGEVLLRHDNLTNLINDEPPYATHPALEPIYKYCSDNNLPMLVHQNSNSQAANDVHEYIDEIDQVLTAFPQLQFIWAHGGISPRSNHPHYTAMLQTMLEQHPNLYIDISWTLAQEISRTPDGWISLIEKWADHMMVGSDVVGKFEDSDLSLDRYTRFFSHLSAPARQQIGYTTANQVYFQSK